VEKLTLQLFLEVPKCVEEMKGIPDPEELSSAISEFLQIIEVKCEMFDKVVLNILKFLSKLGIIFDQHGVLAEDGSGTT